jgi:hypothetical protein
MRTVRAELAKLRAKHPKLGEFKWIYVTGKTPLTAYGDLVDLFFHSPAAQYLSFNCIVVRRADDPSDRMKKLGKDVGFYKTYFTLLRYRLAGDNHVRLDHRSSPRAHPEADVARCLNAIAKRDGLAFKVLSCAAPCSKSEDLLQLADVLCGAVAWAWNGKPSTCGAKPALHQHICNHLKWATLENRETALAAVKFNVWRYRPKKKAGAPTT